MDYTGCVIDTDKDNEKDYYSVMRRCREIFMKPESERSAEEEALLMELFGTYVPCAAEMPPYEFAETGEKLYITIPFGDIPLKPEVSVYRNAVLICASGRHFRIELPSPVMAGYCRTTLANGVFDIELDKMPYSERGEFPEDAVPPD